MRRSKFALVTLAILALATLALAAGLASARSHQISTKVKADAVLVPGQDLVNIVGTVSSPKAACKSGRKIVVTTDEGKFLASGMSDGSGKFTVGPYQPFELDADVKAKPKKLGHKTCALDGDIAVVPQG